MNAAKPQMKFRDLKVGDTVFVVYQKRRGDKECKTETLPVVKVGRKYGYIDRYCRQESFCLNSGKSVYSYFRFDVYHSEAEFRQHEHTRTEFRRLAERIVLPYSSRHIVDLPHDAVVAIHKILDDAGIDRKEPQQ